MEAMRILLVAGGWSTEREISLKGADSVARTLKERGHSVTLFDLSEGFDKLMALAAEHDVAFLNLHGQPGEDGLVQALLEENKSRFGGGDIRICTDYAKVSIVGSGMQSHSGVASSMFEALYESNINIHMISTSEIKISVLIDKKDTDRAVAAIHVAFVH